MKKDKMKNYCAGFLALHLLIFTAYGQSTTGRFLLFNPSAQSSGMGGVGVANSRSSFATYFNPAGIAYAPALSFGGSFVKPFPFFDNVAHSYFPLSVNLGDIGVIGASANFYWEGKHIGDHGEENLTDWQMKLTYAHILTDKVAIGVGIGILRLALSDYGTAMENGKGKSTSLTADLGVLAKGFFPSLTLLSRKDGDTTTHKSVGDTHDEKGISLGIALRNIGPKITMIDAAQADPVSSTLSLGISYHLVCTTPIALLLASDLENRIYEGAMIDYIHWGGELRLYRVLFIRAGYYQDTSGPKNSYSTWGAGIQFYNLNLNIAHYQQSLWPSWHYDGTFSLEIL